jgi:acetyl esterase/lipase
MRENIARLIAEIKMGTPVSPEAIVAVRELYTPFQEAEPYEGIGVTRDQAYGKHPRQQLDVFAPDGIAEPRPVVLFVHGGGFVGGERRTPGTPYYDNVGVWAARNGFVGVTMSYRLAPEFKFPSGPDDVAGAIAWLRENIAAHGGDPHAIVLLGQSAGASHVAAYGARDVRDENVRAIALMSGVYDYAPFETAPNIRAYLGDGLGRLKAAASVAGLVASQLPVLVCVSEFDTEAFHEQAHLLTEAFYQRDGRCANFLYLPRHNHLSQITHLNASGIEDRLLADRLAEFVRIHTTPAVPAF